MKTPLLTRVIEALFAAFIWFLMVAGILAAGAAWLGGPDAPAAISAAVSLLAGFVMVNLIIVDARMGDR